jgi:hypothetical protein
VAAVLLAACGGGDETEPTATGTAAASPITQATAASASPTAVASMTPDERAATEALLKAAALRKEDLPDAFALLRERFITNAQLAQGQTAFPAGATLDNINEWGRILGYEAAYGAELLISDGILLVGVATNLYGDPAGARLHLDFSRTQLGDAESLQLLEAAAAELAPNIHHISTVALSLPPVGEDWVGYEIKLMGYDPHLDKDIDVSLCGVAMQRGRAVAAVTVGVVNAPLSPLEELEYLAPILDERMKDALE